MDVTKQKLNERYVCGLPAALDVMGERWSFLILRGAFVGLRHFEEFQSSLGIARNILANRLSQMVANGILLRVPMTEDRRKVEYRLTEKGAALLPTMVALRQWGEKWEARASSAPILVDQSTQQPIRKVAVYAQDGRELALDDLRWAHTQDIRPVEHLKLVHSA